MIIGAFNYTKSDENTLASTFINNKQFDSEVGISKAVSRVKISDFIGTFIENWHEKNARIEMILEITKNSSNYELVWRHLEHNNILFRGNGFLEEERLIGFYFSANN